MNTPAELLNQLKDLEDRAPLELIDTCATQGEIMVEALSDMIREPRSWTPESAGQWWLLLHAAFILGRIPTDSAGQLLLHLLRRIFDQGDADLQDWLAGCGPALFANKSASVTDAMRQLVTDRSVDWYARCLGVDVVLDVGRRGGDAALEASIDWLAALVADASDDWQMRSLTATSLLDFPRERHRALLLSIAEEAVRRAADESWGGVVFTPDDVEWAFDGNKDDPTWNRLGDPWDFYAPEAIAARQRLRREQEAEETAPTLSTERTGPAPFRATRKPGRNEPCPCGSGKKYKRCCLAVDAQRNDPRLQLDGVQREIDGIALKLLSFLQHHYGPDAMHEAWQEFFLWPDDDIPLDQESHHLGVFLSWLMYCWAPTPEETGVPNEQLHEVIPAKAFLDRKGRLLSPLERGYLQSCLAGQFSFYEVEAFTPECGVSLLDVVTGVRYNLSNSQDTDGLQPGSLVYALLAEVDGFCLVESASEINLPLEFKIDVIELRKQMHVSNERDVVGRHALTPEDLFQWDIELRELFLELSDAILYPAPSTEITSEGYEVEYYKLVYDIDAPAQIVTALERAFTGETQESVVSHDIQTDADGQVTAAKLSILQPATEPGSGPESVVGRISIDTGQMIIKVNSRERAVWASDMVDEVLGKGAGLRVDAVPSASPFMASQDGRISRDDPEVQDAVVEMLRRHYENWMDTPLPGLKQRTPREVAKCRDGREQVALLLDQAEQVDLGLPAAKHSAVFDPIRTELGL